MKCSQYRGPQVTKAPVWQYMSHPPEKAGLGVKDHGGNDSECLKVHTNHSFSVPVWAATISPGTFPAELLFPRLGRQVHKVLRDDYKIILCVLSSKKPSKPRN